MEQSEFEEQVLSLHGMVRGVVHEVLRYNTRFPELRADELESAGWLGALRAVRAYDPELGTSLRNYARSRIHGEILDEIRRLTGVRRDPTVRHFPYSCATCNEEVILNEAEDLWLHLEPHEHDHRAVGMQAETQVRRLRPSTVSIESILRDEENLDFQIPDTVDWLAPVEARIVLQRVLPQLTPRHRQALTDRFLRGHSLAQMGREYGVTESRICQIMRGALEEASDVMQGRATSRNKRGPVAERVRPPEHAVYEPPPPTAEQAKCPVGHVLARDNLVVRADKVGRRRTECMQCQRERTFSRR